MHHYEIVNRHVQANAVSIQKLNILWVSLAYILKLNTRDTFNSCKLYATVDKLKLFRQVDYSNAWHMCHLVFSICVQNKRSSWPHVIDNMIRLKALV